MKSSKRNTPKTALFTSSPTWCGARGIKFSEDFRDVVYKINPVYVSCMYKYMFETNAVKKLRHIDGDGVDLDKDVMEALVTLPVSKDDIDNAGNGDDIENLRKMCSNLSKSDDVLVTYKNYSRDLLNPARSQLPIVRRNTRRNDFHGWDTCRRPHSVSSTGYRKFDDAELQEINRNRSQSASASLFSVRREKTMTPKLQSSGSKLAMNSIFWKGPYQDNSDSSRRDDPQRPSSTGNGAVSSNGFSTPGYIPTRKPIKYKFKHYDHSLSYIDDYREEYTYRQLTTKKATEPQPTTVTATCHCEARTTHISMPVIPMMPLFRWIESEPRRIRATDSNTLRETKLKQQSSAVQVKPITSGSRKISQCTLSSRQSPHYLLSNSGYLRTDYYKNPLCIDTTCKGDKSRQRSYICRSRPTIPSNSHGRIHPTLTEHGPTPGSHPSHHRKSAQ